MTKAATAAHEAPKPANGRAEQDEMAELRRINRALKEANAALTARMKALSEANKDLLVFNNANRSPKIVVDRDMRVRYFTDQAAAVAPSWLSEKGLPLDAPDLPPKLLPIINAARYALMTGQDVDIDWHSDILARDFRVSASSYDNDDGQRAGATIRFTDVTELKSTTRRLEATTALSERSLIEIEELYRTVPQALALLDTEKRYVRVNDKLAQINGMPVEAHMGRTVADIVPEVSAIVDAYLDEVLDSGEARLQVEIIGSTRASPGKERIFEVDFYPLRLRQAIVGVGLCVFDVTEQREMQVEMQRIMRELQHRVKNILANVMAVINQARRDTKDPEEALETLAQRVEALASTHNLLSAHNWRCATLRAIAEQELDGVYGEEAVRLNGPEVELSAKAALCIAMALHEMATNAAKYGALSTGAGTLTLDWAYDGDALRIFWIEAGGPGAHEPLSQGFGSLLVISTIERSLGGKVERFFEPTGFTCVLTIPSDALRVEEQETGDEYGGSNRRTQDPLSGG